MGEGGTAAGACLRCRSWNSPLLDLQFFRVCAPLLSLPCRCLPACLPALLQVYGISTEDMDSLTFGTPKLIRHLMAPASQKTPATEFDYQQVGGGCCEFSPTSRHASTAAAPPPTLVAVRLPPRPACPPRLPACRC